MEYLDKNPEERYKIQAMVEMHLESRDAFELNGKKSELRLGNGGMAVDHSTDDLALAVSRAGGIGTIALTRSGFKKHYAQLDLRQEDGIVGVNSLAEINDFNGNYRLGRRMGADFIVHAAVKPKSDSHNFLREILKAQKGITPQHRGQYISTPIFSSIKSHKGKLRNPYSIFESGSAGGHIGSKVELEEALEILARMGGLPKGRQNMQTCAGGIRTPLDLARVHNAGFNSGQIGTMMVPATETLAHPLHKLSIIWAKEGDFGAVASSTGIPANGSRIYGIGYDSLNGIDNPKRPCHSPEIKGCLEDCNGERHSAEAGGIDVEGKHIGTYCLSKVLEANRKGGKALWFGGLYPERMELRHWAGDRWQIPAAEILARMTAGSFDAIIGNNISNPGMEDRITKEERKTLEQRFNQLRKAEVEPKDLTAKILTA